MEIKRYTPNTIKTYIGAISSFVSCFDKRDIKDLSSSDIQRYIEHKIKDKKISFSVQKCIIGGIKLFYKNTCNKNIAIDYLYPDRSEHKLPKILSQENTVFHK